MESAYHILASYLFTLEHQRSRQFIMRVIMMLENSQKPDPHNTQNAPMTHCSFCLPFSQLTISRIFFVSGTKFHLWL